MHEAQARLAGTDLRWLFFGQVAKRRQIVYQMQQMIFNARPYIILEYVNVLEAWSKKWCGQLVSPDGFETYFSKDPIEQVHQCAA